MNMQMLVQQMDDSFNRLKSLHKTDEQCDQLMEMARGLMEKIEERDRIIAQLRAELDAMKRSQ
jgi:predicted RNase H-like nuclease (RuvC/YqgF family)